MHLLYAIQKTTYNQQPVFSTPSAIPSSEHIYIQDIFVLVQAGRFAACDTI
jgi:hypothetical protein